MLKRLNAEKKEDAIASLAFIKANWPHTDLRLPPLTPTASFIPSQANGVGKHKPNFNRQANSLSHLSAAQTSPP